MELRFRAMEARSEKEETHSKQLQFNLKSTSLMFVNLVGHFQISNPVFKCAHSVV